MADSPLCGRGADEDLPRKLDEIAAKQKQREEEAEARRAARKATGAPVAPAVAPPVDPPAAEATTRAEPERIAPRLNLAPRSAAPGTSWRERQAAKDNTTTPAAATPSAPADVPSEEPSIPRKTGGYVPPHQRAGANRTPARDAAPPANSGPERYVPRPQREREISGSGPGTKAAPAPAPVPASAAAPPSTTDKPEESKSSGKWVPRWKQERQG